jgi:hypothetical protein
MPTPTDINTQTLKALNKIENHLNNINKNDQTLKDVSMERLAIEEDKEKREVKDRLLEKITRKVESSNDKEILKSLDKLKPIGLESITQKGFLDIFVDAFRFTKVDELEPLLRAIDASDDRIFGESALTNIILEQILKKLAEPTFDVEKSFKEIRAAEENLRIQEERNNLIGEQTKVLESLKEDEVKPVSKKGLFAKLFGRLVEVPKMIGKALIAIFSFFKLGNLVKFFTNLKIVKFLTGAITKAGGFIGWILKGLFSVTALAGSFFVGFEIGKFISDWIDEKLGLGKGSFGIWLFDLFHNDERGILKSIQNKLKEWFGVKSVTDAINRIGTRLTEIAVGIGSSIKQVFVDIGIWDALMIPVDAIKEAYAALIDFTVKTFKSLINWINDTVDDIIKLKDVFLRDPLGITKDLITGEFRRITPTEPTSGFMPTTREALELQRKQGLEATLAENKALEMAKQEAFKSKVIPTEQPSTNNVVVDNSRNTTVIPEINLDTNISDIRLRHFQLEMAF